MIQNISKSALREIQTANGAALMSVYVPLEKGMKGHKFNKAQLHSLKSELKKTLTRQQHEYISVEIEAILEKISQDNDSPGVVIFFDGVKASVYELPFTPKKVTQVSTKYDVGQIKEYYSNNKFYYVLAISKKGSKLYEGDMERLKFIPVAGLGQDIETTLHIDEVHTNSLQNHPSASGGSKSAGFHGHGGYKDVKKTIFDEYLRVIDKLVIASIKDKNTPLVLVSVEYEQSAYKHVSKYPSIVVSGVSTNPDDLSPAELHQKTFPLISVAKDASKS